MLSDLVGQLRAHARESLFANAYYLIANNFVSSALGFLFLTGLTRLFPEDVVGKTGALFASITLVALFSNLGLGYGLIRFLPNELRRRSGLLNTGLLLSAVAGIGGAGVLLAIERLRSGDSGFFASPLNASVLIVAGATMTASGVLNEAFVGLGKSRYVFVKDTAMAVVRLGLLLPAWLLSADLLGLLTVWTAAPVVGLLVGLVFLTPRAVRRYRVTEFASARAVMPMFGFATANHVTNLVWYVPRSVLPILVLAIAGAVPAAHFYATWTLILSIGVVPTSMALALFSHGSSRKGRLDRDARRVMKTALILGGVAVLAMVGLGKPILSLFGAAYAQEGWILLVLLSVAIFPFTVNIITMAVLRVRGQLWRMLLLVSVIALVTLGLSWGLLEPLGLPAVGIAWLAAHSLGATVAAWWLMRDTLPSSKAA